MIEPEPWTWLVLGLVLIGLETVTPGIFLIWLGIAALLTGGIDYLFGLSWQAELVSFGLLSLVAVAAGRTLTRGRSGSIELNRRGADLVGRILPLDGPIAAGEGRVRLDDSVWRVVGPDLPGGSLVRVVRLDGATLVVERA